jgi:hypothetical protein
MTTLSSAEEKLLSTASTLAPPGRSANRRAAVPYALAWCGANDDGDLVLETHANLDEKHD